MASKYDVDFKVNHLIEALSCRVVTFMAILVPKEGLNGAAKPCADQSEQYAKDYT